MAKALAAVVGDDLEGGEQQGEGAGGQAAHGEHEAEPTGIGVGSLGADSAEEGEDEHDGECSRAEDEEAGAEDLAGVWL
jgi:hypothetical protein